MTRLVALALFLLLAVVPLRVVAESDVFIPPTTHVAEMRKNLQDERMRTMMQTHPPMPMLEARKLNTDGEGTSVYFSIPINGPFVQWTVDVGKKRQGTYGLEITVWVFNTHNVNKVMLFQTTTGIWRGSYDPVQKLTPGSPEWARAMNMSRLAWKMLCEKFPCESYTLL